MFSVDIVFRRWSEGISKESFSFFWNLGIFGEKDSPPGRILGLASSISFHLHVIKAAFEITFILLYMSPSKPIGCLLHQWMAHICAYAEWHEEQIWQSKILLPVFLRQYLSPFQNGSKRHNRRPFLQFLEGISVFSL